MLPSALMEPPAAATDVDMAFDFKAEEREAFYEALDQLPDFDAEDTDDHDRYEIEEEDWQWLKKAVGTRTMDETVQFAQNEYESLKLDPDLVRTLLSCSWNAQLTELHHATPSHHTDCFPPRCA